jgi:hypothetical protein
MYKYIKWFLFTHTHVYTRYNFRKNDKLIQDEIQFIFFIFTKIYIFLYLKRIIGGLKLMWCQDFCAPPQLGYVCLETVPWR